MRKHFLVLICCALLVLNGCSHKYKRINLSTATLSEDLSNHINAGTLVKNSASDSVPSELPIYKITKRTITKQEFEQMKQQLNLSSDTNKFEQNGNAINGWFSDFGKGRFTMTEEELSTIAHETFSKLPFMEGDYEYSGIRGQDTLSSASGETITRVLVSFYRLLDGIRVIGNERCDMWFDDSGLVEIHIERYNYTPSGTMNTISLEDAVSRIKSPDAFSIDYPDAGRTCIANELRVDEIKVLLVNQYTNGCTILQPVYNFMGTANLENRTAVAFSSKVIAVPETYTYE